MAEQDVSQSTIVVRTKRFWGSKAHNLGMLKLTTLTLLQHLCNLPMAFYKHCAPNHWLPTSNEVRHISEKLLREETTVPPSSRERAHTTCYTFTTQQHQKDSLA